MSEGTEMGQVIRIEEARIRDHFGEMVRGTVEETLNAMLNAEADRCGAAREVSHMLKAIHAQESRDAADDKARVIVMNLRAARMRKAADLIELPRDADPLRLPRPSLAEDPYQQSTGVDHEGNSPTNPRRRCFPRWAVMTQSCGSPAAAHRRNELVYKMLHEHAAALSAGNDSNRSHRLKNVRKILDATGFRRPTIGQFLLKRCL